MANSESVVFDRAASFYDQTRGFPPAEVPAVAALIARAGGFTAETRALEVGVGTGRIALPLAGHCGPYFGIDLSRPMLERLRAKRSTERVHIAQADATRPPLPAHSIDAVVVAHVFHLVPNWRDGLADLARVLRPGGVLLNCWQGIPQHDGLQVLYDAWSAAVPEERQERPGGFAWAHYGDYPTLAGWQPVGETFTHAYTVTESPQTFYQRREQRVWSSTWHLSDAQLARGLAALRTVIAEQFPDPTAPVATRTEFHVRVFAPPA
jgi:SAM-dependent methyltransferase